MTKYIVKNCPSLDDVLDVDTPKIVYKNYCLNKNCHCEDFTDCPIKQVVWLVKVDNTICKHIQRPIPTLNAKILQTLQVEEVE